MPPGLAELQSGICNQEQQTGTLPGFLCCPHATVFSGRDDFNAYWGGNRPVLPAGNGSHKRRITVPDNHTQFLGIARQIGSGLPGLPVQTRLACTPLSSRVTRQNRTGGGYGRQPHGGVVNFQGIHGKISV